MKSQTQKERKTKLQQQEERGEKETESIRTQ